MSDEYESAHKASDERGRTRPVPPWLEDLAQSVRPDEEDEDASSCSDADAESDSTEAKTDGPGLVHTSEPAQAKPENKYRVRYAIAYFFGVLTILFTLFAALCCVVVPTMIPLVVFLAIYTYVMFRLVNANKREGHSPYWSQTYADNKKRWAIEREERQVKREERQAEKRAKRERWKALSPEEKKAERRKRKREKFYSLYPARCTHASGLPLGEGVECEIRSVEGKISITSGMQTFELDKSRIYSMQVLHNEWSETHYVSDAGGAIAGNELFGPLGAIIGGYPQEIVDTYENENLFIIYDEGTEAIVLAAASNGGRNGLFSQTFKKIVDDFNENDTQPMTIDL